MTVTLTEPTVKLCSEVHKRKNDATENTFKNVGLHRKSWWYKENVTITTLNTLVWELGSLISSLITSCLKCDKINATGMMTPHHKPVRAPSL